MSFFGVDIRNSLGLGLGGIAALSIPLSATLPQVNLNFTSGSLDARIGFTRASTATYVNSSGVLSSAAVDEARFDYNAVSLACKGLLIEESRTNFAKYSEDFSQSATWVPVGCAGVKDQTTAPTNTLVGNLLTEDTSTASHSIYQAQTITAGAASSVSFFIKAKSSGSARYFRIAIQNAGGTSGVRAVFNPVNGTVSVAGTNFGTGSGARAIIENYGNGWYRCTLSGIVDASSTTVRGYGYLQSVSGSFSANYAGDGVSGLQIWGGQFEKAAFGTSYIPTTSATATRSADVATMTGTDFSDWWHAVSGSAVVGVLPLYSGIVSPGVQMDDNTSANIIALQGNVSGPELYIKNTTDQAQLDAGTITTLTAYKLGGAWTVNDAIASADGGAVVSDTALTPPVVTQARIGSDGTNYLNGWMQSFRYWPTRIPNIQLQSFSK